MKVLGKAHKDMYIVSLSVHEIANLLGFEGKYGLEKKIIKLEVGDVVNVSGLYADVEKIKSLKEEHKKLIDFFSNVGDVVEKFRIKADTE